MSDGPPRSMAEEPTEVAEVTDEGVVSTPLPMDPDADRFVGRVLANRYKVIKRLGAGGFGAVFAAEDTKIRKQVAVKVLTRDLVTDSAILTRFRKEAEAASKVGHENIVDITDFDRTADGHYFMVMEYLEGVDLGKVIRSGNQLPLARILSIMIQVCRGLNSAHQKGVVHRDLKPGNIFLTTRGSRADFVKLLDFGISKFMEVDDESCRLTRTGQIIGTPLYMAPEQACGEEDVDHRADVYSLGVIMYELVTGQPPFTAVNYLGIIAQHASDPPVPPSKVRPDLEIPKAVETIILKAMGKRPQDRFSTMVQMEGALIEALAAVDPTSAVSYSPDRTPPSLLSATTGLSQRRLRARLPLWAMIAVAAVVGVGGYLLLRSRSSEPTGKPPPKQVVVATPDTRPQQAELPATPDATPPAPKMVVLRITSRPAGATVVDAKGAELGKTPLEHKLPASDTELELTLKLRGYKNATLKLVPKADGKHAVTLKRQPRGSLPDDPKGWGQW